MDPLPWIESLPAPIKEILFGGAADLLGGLATQAVTGALSMAGYAVKRRFQSSPQQQALHLAMAQALYATATAMSDSVTEQEHFLSLLGRWLEDEAVLGELSQVIDPRPQTTLDLETLAEAFEARGFDPDLLGDDWEFAQMVSVLVSGFYDAAAAQPALQGQISIALLRGIAQATAEQAGEMRQQRGQLGALVEGIQRLAPVNLDDLERAYLRGVYEECNHVPLAGDAPVDAPGKRPRLQRIYVDLDTKTPPTFDRVFDRLGTAPGQRPALLARWERLIRPERMDPRQRLTGEPLTDERLTVQSLTAWLDRVDREEEKAIARAAKDLGVELDVLAQALVPLSALDALAAHPQAVLLGDPGSGKSTLTRRLAGNLAAGGLESRDPVEQAWAAQLQQVFGRWLLPVRVVLSTWAQHLAADATGCADDLVTECVRLLAKTAKLDGPRQKEHFVARLTGQPPTVLLLLDGLDEVADPDRRKTILAAVRGFCAAYADVPLLVTCRVRPYTEGKHYTLPLPAFTLAPLDRRAMGDFVDRWYKELTWAGFYTEESAATAQNRLLSALDDPSRKELRKMAETPLLLTMMARVNYSKGLPKGRARLYEAYVKQLLYEWEESKLDDKGNPTRLGILLQTGGVSDTSLDLALNQLAFTVHDQNRVEKMARDEVDDSVDIPAHLLRGALEAIHPGKASEKAAWAMDMVELIDDRSGLIYATEQGSIYRFSHRTFQEYMAARWLATGTTEDVIGKFRAKLGQDQWREALFLAQGYQISVLNQYDSALAIFKELLPDGIEGEADRHSVLLLGEAYASLLGPREASNASQKRLAQDVIQTMPQRLTQLMQSPTAPAPDRLAAGLLLDDLGILPPDLDAFVPIPAKEQLGYDFKIAKYPITNSQYRLFFDEGGYDEDRPWWTEEAVKDIERWSSKEEWRNGPRYWDDVRFNRATQPVVGVSWYEAAAYCEWLTERLRANKTIRPDEKVRLPTEAEWMRAALGAPLSQTGRGAGGEGERYPWGPDFNPAFANTEESGLGQTTPVHMYPDGKSAEEVWDLSGNVWEWSKDDHSFGKALRGGSWYNKAQASARSGHYPDDGYFNRGFRCVVVPSLS